GPPQVRGDHHRRAGIQRHADAGHRGTDARVLGDVARVVEGDVEVGADEYALAGKAACLGQRGKGFDVGHDGKCLLESTKTRAGCPALGRRKTTITWPPSGPRWYRACGWRSPTHCRTTTRP